MFIIIVSMMKNLNETTKDWGEEIGKAIQSQPGNGLSSDVYITEPKKGKSCLNPVFSKGSVVFLAICFGYATLTTNTPVKFQE